MSSLQHRIAILTSLAAQLRELEQLRERVRKAKLLERAAGRSPWSFSSVAQEAARGTGLIPAVVISVEPNGITHCEQIFSALPPRTDILGRRVCIR